MGTTDVTPVLSKRNGHSGFVCDILSHSILEPHLVLISSSISSAKEDSFQPEVSSLSLPTWPVQTRDRRVAPERGDDTGYQACNNSVKCCTIAATRLLGVASDVARLIPGPERQVVPERAREQSLLQADRWNGSRSTLAPAPTPHPTCHACHFSGDGEDEVLFLGMDWVRHR